MKTLKLFVNESESPKKSSKIPFDIYCHTFELANGFETDSTLVFSVYYFMRQTVTLSLSVIEITHSGKRILTVLTLYKHSIGPFNNLIRVK